MNFANPAWRKRPVRTAARVVASLLRRPIVSLRKPAVSYDEGRARIIANLDTALGLQLYRYGLHDVDVELARRLLQPGDLFVDGGANVGLFTLAAAARVGPAGRVIAFEPASATRRVLSRNVDLNDFSWVRIRSEALDERVCMRRFVSMTGDSAGLSSFRPESATGNAEVENVTATSIDEVLTPEDRARLRLIKLDLEGAEYGALLGAKNVLAEVGPDFLIELEPGHLERQGATAQQLVDLFRAAGYGFYRPKWSNGKLSLGRETAPDRPSKTPNLYVSRSLDRARGVGVTILT